MYYLFETMPPWLYILAGLAIIGAGIWGSIDLHKKKPGHPIQIFLYAILVTVLLLVIHQGAEAYSTSLLFQKITDIAVCISAGISAVLFFVCVVLSVKKGYGNGNLKDLWHNIGIPFVILIVAILIFVTVKHFTN